MHFKKMQSMLRNYLTLTWRNLAKNSTYSIIIISGLVLAYSACLVIFLFIDNETSYDRQSPDADRIFRVTHIAVDDAGTRINDTTTPKALGPLLSQDITAIESTVRIIPTWSVRVLVTGNKKSFYEPRIVGADSNMISFFGFKTIAGNPKLDDPTKVVVTESIAKKYFGTTDVVGETLNINGPVKSYTITAVVADMPPNMHFHFDIFVALWGPEDEEAKWDTYNYYTYIKLKNGANIDDVNPQVAAVFKKYRPGRSQEYSTQPLTDIHLRSKAQWELEPNGDHVFITIFVTIGSFIFLIAVVNYINLSIVQTLNRAKEVGIRKVSGAMGRELIDQFLLESTLISFAAMMLAVLVVQAVVPFINVVFGQHLRSLFSLPFYYIILVFLFAVAAGIISGLYPALYLSAFRPATVLKGVFQPGSKNLLLRKSLVVMQFAISISLITGAALVFMQVDYLRSKELGFNKDQVIIMPNLEGLESKAALKETLLNIKGVTAVGASDAVLGGQNSTTQLSATGIQIRTNMHYSDVDEDFLHVTDMQLVAGRTFDASDVKGQSRLKVILNERAVADLGLTVDEAIGHLVTNNPDADSVIYLEVVGVVKDFHFASLRTPIMPYAFILNYTYFNNFAIKVNTTDYDRLLEELRGAWTKFAPGPFEYFFLDQQFDGLYRAEENFEFIFFILTIISIYIACSGLFAVASYFIKRRAKEIGIRKALGASVSQVTWLVSSGFLRMVIVANLLAWPATWFFMDDWLNGFAYRIDMNWIIFFFAAISALVIAIVTIGGQSMKAARANPIQSLRNE
jgi:putative ABC transport system permease protein